MATALSPPTNDTTPETRRHTRTATGLAAHAHDTKPMNTRRLLSSTLLYGAADVAVMAVGGFLLLPLYTRSLTQAEFGDYVAVRTNIDIFTYLLHFGVPSALARLYFDHKKNGTEHAYMSSIVCFFLVVLAAASALLWLAGAPLWKLLSPEVAVQPYLPLSTAIAACGFLSAISIVWLRAESKVVTVVALQLGASCVLAGVAFATLLGLGMKLSGILCAVLASSLVAALALPALFGSRFRFGIERAAIAETLRFAAPIFVGYVAYFVLNRISTLLLQRHVPAAELAVFGLSQQLSLIVAIAGTSFGMVLQPAVYSSEPGQVGAIIHRSSRILASLMFCVAALLMLFSREVLAIVAPQSYSASPEILLLLIVANFTNAFTLMSDTVLLYHRRPKTSVAVSIASALVAAALGAWLIPRYHVLGAGVSLAIAFCARMVISQGMAFRVSGHAVAGLMAASMAALSALAVFCAWLQSLGLPRLPDAGIHAGVALLVLLATWGVCRNTTASAP